MSAKVTFGNFNGHSQPAPHVSLHTKAVRVEPVPVPTPSPSVEVGGIKRRHPQATLGEGGSTDHPTTPQRYGSDALYCIEVHYGTEVPL